MSGGGLRDVVRDGDVGGDQGDVVPGEIRVAAGIPDGGGDQVPAASATARRPPRPPAPKMTMLLIALLFSCRYPSTGGERDARSGLLGYRNETGPGMFWSRSLERCWCIVPECVTWYPIQH
ncbi:hypothetical protein [Amycolatopsis sp. w19]|uniref:hypothetical protein n=1 Tax=Amycolatopsis sp. w19 TaxID=3448134 RepID=UPI003F1D1B51